MIWRRIPKENYKAPTKGGYSDWKEQLADEGFRQCVYCAISEPAFGGFRNFHVEHHRPKKIFNDRINDYSNLFYACAICNSFKGHDWPNEPIDDFSVASYPYPAEIDYADLFVVDRSGVVLGSYTASKYLAERLFLNRPQLILERRASAVFERLGALTEDLTRLAKVVEDKAGWMEITERMKAITSAYASYLRARPYHPPDVKR